MRVLMLSWEFPPKSVGGLAQHVYDLTGAMIKQGTEVHLVTVGAPGIAEYELVQGVHVHRVTPYQLATPDFITWVMQLNIAMLEKCLQLTNNHSNNYDIIHAHDWLVAYAARALKHALQIPLTATIHATEYGRNNGLHNDLQRHISQLEWWLCYEAWRVIVCSHYMHREIRHVFQVPKDKLSIIPNGVNPQNFVVQQYNVNRDDYAAPHEKIVFYVGRLVREKGVQVLIDSITKILHYHPQTKFVIAGKGPYEITLKRQAMRLGVEQHIYFTGYIDDDIRNNLYNFADVAVFPSLYEPFGIVALEGMAAKTPVVVSDTGGLGEIINHGVNGLKAYVGNENSLADNILHILLNPQGANSMKELAYQEVTEKYNWQGIAGQTIALYQELIVNRGLSKHTSPTLVRLAAGKK